MGAIEDLVLPVEVPRVQHNMECSFSGFVPAAIAAAASCNTTDGNGHHEVPVICGQTDRYRTALTIGLRLPAPPTTSRPSVLVVIRVTGKCVAIGRRVGWFRCLQNLRIDGNGLGDAWEARTTRLDPPEVYIEPFRFLGGQSWRS